MEKTKNELTASRFIRSGHKGNLPEPELAAACEKLIQATIHVSLKSAWKLAEKYARQAKGQGSILSFSSYRLLARVAHLSGRHQTALKTYLTVRKLSGKDRLTQARIDRILIDVYMYLGQHDLAILAARRAMRVFKLHRAESDLAQTRVNYANLLHRQDRHRQAEKLYREAADFFEKADNQLAAARCNYNRANTLVQLFDMDHAEELYLSAYAIYHKNEYELEACDAEYGLAWLYMLKGNFHKALLKLTECEKIYRNGKDIKGESLCILDRAEVFLTLGLCHDAFITARRAERKLNKLALHYEQAKAALFAGQAGVILGKKKEAKAAMKRAEKGFRLEKSFGFLGVVNLLSADLSGITSHRGAKKIITAKKLFMRAQLPMWEAVGDIYLAANQKYVKDSLKRLARNAAVHHIPHLHTLWQTIYGDYEFDRGRISSAYDKWQSAANRLDAVRAQLPPPELRNAFSRKISSPHVRLIKLDLNRNRESASAWLERYKTAGIWAPLIIDRSLEKKRENIKESLAALANQVEVLNRHINSQSGLRNIGSAANNRQLTRMQKNIGMKIMEIEADPQAQPDSVAFITDRFRCLSQARPIVQFFNNNDDIFAFIHQENTVRYYRYPGRRQQLENTLLRWRFIVESEIMTGYLGHKPDYRLEESLWRELGNWLWKPLEISRSHKEILILPEAGLANIPWPALIVDSQPLLDQHQFILSPSLLHYWDACNNQLNSHDICIFKGASDNIPETGQELNILSHYAAAKAKIFTACRREDWLNLGNAELWHYAGHAEIRYDNPFYSYLVLDDGPLFAADFRLKRCRVGLVALSACRSGEQFEIAGEESSGLVRSLLEMGARNVLASHWPVSDRSTSVWMKLFYKKYFEHKNILESINYASKMTREKYRSAYHWAAYSIFGAGNLGVGHEK